MAQPWNNDTNALVGLLQQLIATPSPSREEGAAGDVVQQFLEAYGVPVTRHGYNVVAQNQHFDAAKPTLLLNSHLDTVKPNSGYTRNPYEPTIEDGKLYGLGSNDAGGALVTLAGAFLHFYAQPNLPFNVVLVASAEEEISGSNGMESLVPVLPKIDIAIVGEPTLMHMAVAERGLLVVDAVAVGKAGHAARNEGINAIYLALDDINWFRNYRFEKDSEWLGPVSMNVTIIQAGTAHNQVPAECTYTVDIRLNEHYTHQQVLDIIGQHVKSQVKARSTRIKPSFIDMGHPMVLAAKDLNTKLYGSPTTSDQALMPWASVKIGPGDSARSHTADEFIYLDEITQGYQTYVQLIQAFGQQLTNQTQQP